MTQIGLPVPPGFVITTEASLDHLEQKKSGLNPRLSEQIRTAMAALEKETGKNYADPANPLPGIGSIRGRHEHAGHDGYHLEPGPQ